MKVFLLLLCCVTLCFLLVFSSDDGVNAFLVQNTILTLFLRSRFSLFLSFLLPFESRFKLLLIFPNQSTRKIREHKTMHDFYLFFLCNSNFTTRSFCYSPCNNFIENKKNLVLWIQIINLRWIFTLDQWKTLLEFCFFLLSKLIIKSSRSHSLSHSLYSVIIYHESFAPFSWFSFPIVMLVR